MRSRPDGSLLLAIALHVPIALVVLHALAPSRYVEWWSSTRVQSDAPVERLQYVTIPPQPAIPPVPPGDPPTEVSQPAAAAAPPVPAVAASGPAPAPSRPALATGDAGTSAVGTDPTDSGMVVLLPRRTDPRIWNTRPTDAPEQESHVESVEGSLARSVRASNDSIAALGVQTVRPEWVVSRNGRRYGVDDKGIYLGKVTLPAMLVGLLPIAGFGCVPTMYMPDRPVRDSVGMTCAQVRNPKLDQRTRLIDQMNAEVRARAPVVLAGQEEIARIAARKDREREKRLRARKDAGSAHK